MKKVSGPESLRGRVTPDPSRSQFFDAALHLFVGMFTFDLQFLLTAFADPAMLAIDEGVIMTAGAVVVGAEITFHIVKF